MAPDVAPAYDGHIAEARCRRLGRSSHTQGFAAGAEIFKTSARSNVRHHMFCVQLSDYMPKCVIPCASNVHDDPHLLPLSRKLWPSINMIAMLRRAVQSA